MQLPLNSIPSCVDIILSQHFIKAKSHSGLLLPILDSSEFVGYNEHQLPLLNLFLSCK